MSESCERWAEVQDRLLVGDDVSDDDAHFAEEHAKSCRFCGAEVNAWNELERDSLPENEANDRVERALSSISPESKKMPLRGVPMPSYAPTAGHAAPSLDAGRTHRSAYVAGAVAAAFALAAGAALLVSTRPPIVPPGPSAVLASVQGDVRVMDAPAKQGGSVPEGARISVGPNSTACLSFDDGKVKTCLDASSELTLKYTAPEARHLTLDHGTVATALDKLPVGHSFSIDAKGGSATVTGTVFSVTAANGAVIIRVHEGSVRAEGPNAHGQSVATGNEIDVMSGAARPVENPVRDHELTLLGISVPRAEPLPAVSTTSEPEASTSATPSDAKPPSAAEMLTAARKLRAAGNAQGAADAYKKLMSVHPKSAEASAAQMSLAELELGPLGDPAGALRAYDAYLKSGGGLAQEARYGRIQALRRLGRTTEANAAIDEFVKLYPNSVQTRALKPQNTSQDAP